MTQFAMNTDNPLRKIWEGHKVFPNPRKETITLQIGKLWLPKLKGKLEFIILFHQAIRQFLEIFRLLRKA